MARAPADRFPDNRATAGQQMSRSEDAAVDDAMRDPMREIDAAAWRRMLAGAAGWVALHRGALNKINVYPVPDGDTGANLARTLAAAAAAPNALDDHAPLQAVAQAASDAALLGARGSSGVIASQWLRGFSAALGARERIDAPLLRDALAAASETARAAVSEPREGTMISAARELAEAAPNQSVESVDELLADAVEALAAAVERTPQLNPVLADAGVVDAGARGLEIALRGMLAGLRGDPPPPAAADFGGIDPAWLSRRLDDASDLDGFCTELIVEGAAPDDALRAALAEIAAGPLEDGAEETVMLAPDGDRLRVHLHTAEPDLAYAQLDAQSDLRAFWAVDMRSQAARVHEDEADPAVLAVVQGAGFVRVFRELGATALLSGGASDNPSVELILSAAESTHARDVIVLPNHANVIPAAQRARELSDHARLHIVATDTQAAGVAALVNRVGGIPAEDVAAEMEEGRDAVLVGEVSRAARAVAGDIPLREGQPFGLLEGRIAAAGETTGEAARKLARRMAERRPAASLLTIFAGEEPSQDEADALAEAIAADIDIEVDLVWGDQPHYPWLLALE